jgi:hypothetical protein
MDDRMTSSARITDTGRKGDLCIGFGFERINGRPDPAMYVWARNSPRQVAMVPLRLMYLFDTRDKNAITGEPECMPQVRKMAHAIYGGLTSKAENHRVLSAIEDFMTDLKNMPPPETLRNPEMIEQVMRQRGYDVIR